MRALAICCALLPVLGCAKREETPATPPPPPPANFAGAWSVKGYSATGDSLTAYQLHATASDSGWTIVFPGRAPVPVRVVARGGDSVVTDAGPYESVLRRGVQVTTRGTFHVTGDSLRGTTRASYAGVRTADSVLMVTSRGSRSMH